MEPVLENGQTVQEMDVPDDFHHNVKAFYAKLG